MKRIILRLDEALLRRCRQLALKEKKSVSRWVADLIVDALALQPDFELARRSALRNLEVGLELGGCALPRVELHQR